MLFCSAIIGFLCVQAPIGGITNVKLEDGGIWVANTVEAKNWTAHWGRSTEWAPPRIDPTRLAKACEGDVCVSYWRKCTGFACDYTFDEGHGAAFGLHVEAKGRAGLDEAMRALGIVMKWQPVTAVPLASMSVEGKGSAPPTCAAEPREGPPVNCAKGD